VKRFAQRYIALFVLVLPLVGSAQNEIDALRYSYREPFGSARFMAMGGAFGALGGDLGSLAWNPAGLGVYRRNDFGVSLAISGYNTDALYNDQRVSDSKFDLHVPNIGLAVAHRNEDPDWTFINYGIGFNKVLNFNRRYTVRGDVMNNTLLNVFANQANGVPFDDVVTAFPFGAGLAWETFLLDPIDGTTDQYETAIPFGRATQEMIVETSGHMSETLFGMGANYRDWLYLGASVGLTSARFTQSLTYREFDLEPELELDQFTLTDDLVIGGNGWNLKLGAIARVTNWLRLGAAWHSRTTLRLNDVWDTRMTSRFKDGDRINFDGRGAFDYRISVPSRVILSSAFMLGRDGIISADYERVNYRDAELRPASFAPNGYDFASENNAVNTLFRSTHNVRVGAEYRIAQVYRARAGFVFQQNPYTQGATMFNTNRMTYSLGGGFRNKKYYAEFAYMLRFANEEFYLYDPALVNATELIGRKGEFVISVGLRY